MCHRRIPNNGGVDFNENSYSRLFMNACLAGNIPAVLGAFFCQIATIH